MTSVGRLSSATAGNASAGADAEPESPEETYDRYFELVWRNLRRLGVGEHAVQDAVQDVFLVVYRRWAEFERRSSVRTWVFGIALRVAKDYRRLAERSSKLVDEGHEGLRSSDCPQESAARLEAAALLSSMLQAMDEEQRAILVLTELEELSLAEAAAAMNLNLSTAYKRLRAAHRTLEAAWIRHQARDRWRLEWET